MAKNITFDRDVRNSLLAGVDKFARAVKSTLGPRGRYAVVDRGFGAPKVTKDGASVADEVEFTDAVENVAARLMREAAKRTADEAGDGSTTSTVLAEAIFARGTRNIVAGANPLMLQRGIMDASEKVIEELEGLAVKVKDNQIESVATTAGNNNPEVGKTLAKAIREVGRDGVITIEEGKSIETTVDIVEGMQFDRGYLSQYFVTDEANARTVLREPLILILEEKVSNLSQILPVLEKALERKKPLLIIAEDIEGEALSTLVVNQQRGVLKCAAVKAPGYGDRRKAMLEDIAVVTGGAAITKDLGLEPGTISLSHLGTAKRVEITNDSTIVVDGGGKKKDITERARQVRVLLDQPNESKYDQEKLRERLARLTGGIAEIKVGGATETEVKERKKLYENALSTTQAALEEGILPGGGVAFLKCAESLDGLRVRDADTKIGVEILRDALEAPFRQLAKNAGEEPSRLLRKWRNSKKKNYGFDFQKKAESQDLVADGIIDSVRVARLALKNAASVASMLFSTSCVVTEIPTEEEDHHHDEAGVDYASAGF